MPSRDLPLTLNFPSARGGSKIKKFELHGFHGKKGSKSAYFVRHLKTTCHTYNHKEPGTTNASKGN